MNCATMRCPVPVSLRAGEILVQNKVAFKTRNLENVIGSWSINMQSIFGRILFLLSL